MKVDKREGEIKVVRFDYQIIFTFVMRVCIYKDHQAFGIPSE